MIRSLFARLLRLPPALRSKRPRRLIAFARRYFSGTLNVVAFVFLLFIVFVALAADLIASDSPLAYKVGDDVRILPGRLDNHAPHITDIESALAHSSRPGEWVLLPPIPYGPNQTKMFGHVSRLEPPSARHLLGTDDTGRDVAARMIHGSRSALMVGLGSVALYLLVAVLIGAVAGYFGGLADRMALRLIETLTSFPTFFLILAIQGIIGATGVLQLILVIGLTRWTDVARLTRAEVLRLVNEDYVLAARALGLGNLRILFRHVLPGAIGPALIAGTFGVAGAILIESTLSFLGFGVPNTVPSWGQLLTDALYNEGAYWLALFPGLLLFLTLISINLVGEGLREALDPV
jgi:peptide/nickel transport system permease protein